MTLSPKTQLIIVLIILAAIAVWIIWKLVSKKGADNSACMGCSLSEMCDKKNLEPSKRKSSGCK